MGATVPESAGLYFSWGNKDGHPADDGYNFSDQVYQQTPGANILSDIPLNQDAARATLGYPWRIPSSADFRELFDNCSNIWTSVNGVYGRLFTSNINNKTLFFPAAGFIVESELNNYNQLGDYWSKSYDSETNAVRFNFSDSATVPNSTAGRYRGFSIRPVFNV